ncbi:MAG: PDZ domain-containing protein [Chitinophagaceae bacterium]|nr:MAG: PDZ domain-containing protein [Chitinophagaceae bacterium]
MKTGLSKLAALALLATGFSHSVKAQGGEIETRQTRVRNGGEQIIITQKSDSAGKMVIVVDGDNITVNGKPVDENDKSISVNRHKIRDLSAFSYGPATTYTFNGENMSNSAVLGVTTANADKGLKIQSVSKGSGAEKAGLKKEDIITKIDGEEVTSPDALHKKIRAHKPGDKVEVAYLRAGKAGNLTAELGKLDQLTISGVADLGTLGGQLNLNSDDFARSFKDLQIESVPRTYGQGFSFGGAPKLGLTVQDTDDGKGVKVLSVSDESNAAKAGIEEEDVITEVDGKAINSADEIAKIMRDNKDKTSVKFKYLRDGKSNSTEVRIPRKLKTANL